MVITLVYQIRAQQLLGWLMVTKKQTEFKVVNK